jgi:hypothetical protein
LLLLITAAWLYAPDVALIYGYDPSSATYQANGLYGAALALYALTARGAPPLFDAAVLTLSGVLWWLQFVCDLFYTGGAPSAAICDDVTNRPINLICAAALLGICALADSHRGRNA